METKRTIAHPEIIMKAVTTTEMPPTVAYVCHSGTAAAAEFPEELATDALEVADKVRLLGRRG